MYLLRIRNDGILEEVEPHLHHPLRKLRAKLILEYLNGKLGHEQFTKAYEQTKYGVKQRDNKHNSVIYVAINASSLALNNTRG